MLRTSTVPLPNERIGDFSPATAAAVGVKYPTIYDPTTCQPAFSGTNCQPFANNTVPSGSLDSTMQALMALFPLPNTTTAGSPPDLNNYIRNALLTDFEDNYDGRADWTPSSSDTVFVRYNYSNRNRDIPGYLGGLADGTSTSAWGNQILKSHSAVLGWTHILSQSMVNEFRFGWVRDYSYAQQQPFTLSTLTGSFVPGIPNNPALGGGVPLTEFSNYAFEGSADFLPKKQVPMQYQYNDTLSLIRGNRPSNLAPVFTCPCATSSRTNRARAATWTLPPCSPASTALRGSVFPARASPMPMDFSATPRHAADQCFLCRPAPVDGIGLCGRRLEGHTTTDAESRAAL